MRVELSDEDKEDIANRIVEKLNSHRYVTAKEAASILGMSISRVYQIKDKLGYIKTGDNKQSPIRFNLRTLLKFHS